MSDNFGLYSNFEQVADFPTLPPAPTAEEVLAYLQRLDTWRRTREPIADGGVMAKFVTKADLLRWGLLVFDGDSLVRPDQPGDTPGDPVGTNHFFTPRTEIILPVDASGTIMNFVDAWTDYEVTLVIDGSSDTANWTFSKVDQNCTSTLVSNRITITSLGELGVVTSTTSTSYAVGMPAGWTRAEFAVYGGGKWVIGFFGTSSIIRTSVDFVATTDVNVGLSGQWQGGAYGSGRFVLYEDGANSNRAITSVDGGVNWVSQVLPTTAVYTELAYGNKFILSSLSSAVGLQSPTGASGSWTNITLPATGCYIVWFGGERWGATDSSGNVYVSTNGGTAWSAAQRTAMQMPAGQFASGMAHLRGLLIVGGQNAGNIIYVTAGNGTWTRVVTPANYEQPRQWVVVAGILYMIDSNSLLFWTADGYSWKGGAVIPGMGALPSTTNKVVIGSEWNEPYLPTVSTANNSLRKHNLSNTSDSVGAVAVTANKPGDISHTLSLPVRKGVPIGFDNYAFSALPGSLLLPSTADGVVTDFTNAIITAKAQKNGADDTANWTWTWATSNAGLTPTTGTGNVATITGMLSSLDTANVVFTGTKPGQPIITGAIGVVKSKGADVSGIRIGTGMAPFSVDGTAIGVKFMGDGRIMIQRNGAAYALISYWAFPVDASRAANHFIRVTVTAGALTSGTTGSWLALTTDREYRIDQTVSGTYTADLTVDISTPTSGANSLTGAGSLRLIVP